jgi:hypothetical protein
MEYNKHRLCLYQGGGLGNDIFQYASMYAIVKSKGMRFVVPADQCLRQRSNELNICLPAVLYMYVFPWFHSE